MPVTRKPIRELSLEEFLLTHPRIAGGERQPGEPDPAAGAQGGQDGTQGQDDPQAANGPQAGQSAAESAPEGEDALPDAVKAILKKERDARRDAERRAKDASERAQSYEDRDKSDLQKATERAERAEREASEIRAREMRLRVAAAKQLPAELAERLQGTTEDELTADADRLAALVKPAPQTGTGFDGGQRGAGSLTRAQIEAMSPDELNRRWPEVQDALKRL